MAIVNRIEKKVKMVKDEVIKYQILTYCFINDVQTSNADLDCLTELGKVKSMDLTEFCDRIFELNIFKSSQSARNSITKAEKKGLIVKAGGSKKTIELNPEMAIETEGTLLLDFKILGIESEES
jgi:hypothetical protein